MKKHLYGLFIVIILFLISGCDNNRRIEDKADEKILQCLVNELDGYILTENSNLNDISLSEISSKKDKISYFKGAYSDKENMYIILVENNKTFDADVMKDFESYFLKKYSTYQRHIIGSEGISIYLHNNLNDIDFNELANKCVSNNIVSNGKNIPDKILNKLNGTNKIVIKTGNKELGVVKDKKSVTEILNFISNSRQYGDDFLCDGHGFDFEIYDSNNELIDIVYVWGDGKRIIPKSIYNAGCSYYTNINKDTDLRKIIERETDYVFYNILDISYNCDSAEELVYKDNNYNYYLKCMKSNEILITFSLTNKTMTLKYALNNNYISAEKIHKDYPDVLIRKNK